ncbi:MAG: M23 family metallopeptidase, partial [Butyrivibrio sp.]|nr:M23 family metallopeptidase [Butyrivibrio sp.]
MSRVLKSGSNQVTQTYAQHCANVAAGKAWAKGVDVVKYKSQVDKVTAHSAGKVIKIVDYLGGTNGVIDREGMGYGNYVMILHDSNYVTLYAHLEAVYVHEGQTVNQCDEIGLMGNTGNSFGAHLHFEVRKYKAAPAGNLHDVNAYEWLDPTEYLDKGLPGTKAISETESKFLAAGAGTKIGLSAIPVYNSETAEKAVGKRSGTYYIWSNEVKNGRVRMTNAAEHAGVKGQVSFWVDVADIGALIVFKNKTETVSTSSASAVKIKAGTKVELKDTPVYNTETGASVGIRSGVYFIWSDEVKNGRARMTNSAARVGISGQVSFWVSVADIGCTADNAAADSKAETAQESFKEADGGMRAVKAGTKVELKDTPVFNTETGASVGNRSGVYFIWSDEVKNGRVRMTNSAARVGVSGQVSFWV